MIVKRFFDSKLAQTSYLIGCGRLGAAVVIDPNRDVDQYVRAAEDEGVRITHVTETHIHADFVSGARELAERTGATLFLSDEGDANWKYDYAAAAAAVLVRDGDSFSVGNIRIEVVHTPGHTPEHISFLITDTAAANEPIAIATGDFVFVGDVGRPDLLEKAAMVKGTMEGAARTLFRTLKKFKAYPDWLQIWPGHGAGSACGKGLSAVPHSTVGYEKRFNWALAITDEDAFVTEVLRGQPEPPKYFGEMKRINKQGPRILHGLRRPELLGASRLDEVMQSGAIVVDTRHAADFAAGHVPGTINIPLNRSFNTWAGWLIPFDRDIHLIIDDQCTGCIDEAARDLAMIGLDRIAGYFDAEAIVEWERKGRDLETLSQITARELDARLRAGDVAVIDVRGQVEWETGHIQGAGNIPLGYLADHLDVFPRDRAVVMQCQSGARSAIASSILRAAGFDRVLNLSGGIMEWQRAGLPIETGASELRNAAA